MMMMRGRWRLTVRGIKRASALLHSGSEFVVQPPCAADRNAAKSSPRTIAPGNNKSYLKIKALVSIAEVNKSRVFLGWRLKRVERSFPCGPRTLGTQERLEWGFWGAEHHISAVGIYWGSTHPKWKRRAHSCPLPVSAHNEHSVI